MVTKTKYWAGVLYPENMRPSWKDDIADVLQVPFAYAVHDQDLDAKGKPRKVHVHVMVVWPGNTTLRAVLEAFNGLSLPGKKCCSTAEKINNVRHAYDYLIHDTDSCRKKGKVLYPQSARVCGNNFEIGQYEQLSSNDKQDMLFELIGYIITEGFETIVDFTVAAMREYPSEYLRIMIEYNSILERYCRGNRDKHRRQRELERERRFQERREKEDSNN